MISDVLAEAVSGLDHYLDEPDYAETYGAAVRERVLAVRREMDWLRATLDAPPPPGRA
jgi:hypothetical protein